MEREDDTDPLLRRDPSLTDDRPPSLLQPLAGWPPRPPEDAIKKEEEGLLELESDLPRLHPSSAIAGSLDNVDSPPVNAGGGSPRSRVGNSKGKPKKNRSSHAENPNQAQSQARRQKKAKAKAKKAAAAAAGSADAAAAGTGPREAGVAGKEREREGVDIDSTATTPISQLPYTSSTLDGGAEDAAKSAADAEIAAAIASEYAALANASSSGPEETRSIKRITTGSVIPTALIPTTAPQSHQASRGLLPHLNPLHRLPPAPARGGVLLERER